MDQSIRILLVDDSLSTRKMMGMYFRELGYKNFETCNDGHEAMRWLTSAKPPFDLVFSDWHMPNLTGLGLLEKIRASEDANLKNIPVILATAERKPEEIKRAIAAGVSGYLVKPYSTDSIQKTLEKLKSSMQKTG